MSAVVALTVRYQRFAADAARMGLRPEMLECERAQGEHCSSRFARFVQRDGLATAVLDLCGRCPFGIGHAAKALAWSATMAAVGPIFLSRRNPDTLKPMACTGCMLPMLFTSSNECIPGERDCLGCGM